ncbi:hypothetical protein BKA82DRAFT_4019339 [Pisolithus tinctorius]|nr:hypothetical protein BKA82DRAFT_4019339 [Pisolithus tinctorius]
MVKFTPRKKARYATGQSNESPTRAGSSSIQEPNLVQGNDADLYCYMDDASPPRTSRIPKSQNSYLEEWLPYKSRYLSVLLDMEAPPNVMACFVCKAEGAPYRCMDYRSIGYKNGMEDSLKTSLYGWLVWCYTWAMPEHHAWQEKVLGRMLPAIDFAPLSLLTATQVKKSPFWLIRDILSGQPQQMLVYTIV